MVIKQWEGELSVLNDLDWASVPRDLFVTLRGKDFGIRVNIRYLNFDASCRDMYLSPSLSALLHLNSPVSRCRLGYSLSIQSALLVVIRNKTWIRNLEGLAVLDKTRSVRSLGAFLDKPDGIWPDIGPRMW